MPRLNATVMMLAAWGGLMAAAVAEDWPAPVRETNPQLRPSDEQFLLQMRKSMSSEAPKWLSESPEQQEQWFREGLKHAAHSSPAQPSSASPNWPNSHPSGLHSAGYSDWGSAPAPAAGPYSPSPAPASWAPAPSEAAPEPWRRLLGASEQLGHIAHDLDQQGLWSESDVVRTAAAELRVRARRLAAGDPDSDPDHAPETE
ncbi:hypothetical protein Pla123a_37670 [Posidoniimonas polymericola]|uniref:Uncharacterized protein n=1 Tax=Posidoniimonas polymericola TaxID=2528002 RepID=A0A5C5YHV9_9BACT|nr:hypothetical protein [Posidoniimonas polymericola]TWT73432.1 hypothetical protein Pla123a_37670 [Posidoniimonas polymericola]